MTLLMRLSNGFFLLLNAALAVVPWVTPWGSRAIAPLNLAAALYIAWSWRKTERTQRETAQVVAELDARRAAHEIWVRTR